MTCSISVVLPLPDQPANPKIRVIGTHCRHRRAVAVDTSRTGDSHGPLPRRVDSCASVRTTLAVGPLRAASPSAIDAIAQRSPLPGTRRGGPPAREVSGRHRARDRRRAGAAHAARPRIRVRPRNEIARIAARNAALLSGSLALPPGPLGMLTVLPDLYLIWKIQRQMVADIFALHGRTAELTRTHMLYCLFRHMASQVLRDVVVRAGERALVRQLSSTALTQRAGIARRHRRAARRRHVREPLGAARRRRGRRRLRVLGHAAGREDGAPAARDDAAGAGAAFAARQARQPGATDDVRTLRTAQPSGRDRARVRARASAGRPRALQHRADRPTCRSCASTPTGSASSSACAGASSRAGRRTRRSARG